MRLLFRAAGPFPFQKSSCPRCCPIPGYTAFRHVSLLQSRFLSCIGLRRKVGNPFEVIPWQPCFRTRGRSPCCGSRVLRSGTNGRSSSICLPWSSIFFRECRIFGFCRRRMPCINNRCKNLWFYGSSCRLWC